MTEFAGFRALLFGDSHIHPVGSRRGEAARIAPHPMRSGHRVAARLTPSRAVSLGAFARLEIVLLARDTVPGHPMRLSTAIEAMTTLWDVVSAMSGTTSPLNVVACDPAVDIVIAFTGPKREIMSLRTLLRDVTECAAESRLLGLEEVLQLIASRISASKPERCGQYLDGNQRRALHRGVRMFLQAGASLP